MSDQQAREQALDISQSFIVQAPAGSGKTELLIQRYLALLASVTSPKQILAITFTRKAAAEMRHRVSQALHTAATQPLPEAAHHQCTWQLARQALQQDRQYQWGLLDYPQQMQMMTIDALCAQLNQHMPVSAANQGGQTTERAWPLYQAAAEALLEELDDSALGQAIGRLIRYLDNNLSYAVEHLSLMLARRDQWLPTLSATSSQGLRIQLEATLQAIVESHIQALAERLPLQAELSSVLSFADSQLSEPLYAGLANFTAIDASSLTSWQALANLLLTKDGSWRKSFTKRQGFPASSGAPTEFKSLYADKKAELLACVQTIQQTPRLQLALRSVLTCPSSHYNDQQWQMVEDLLSLLPRLCAHLQLVFNERGQIDFTAVSLGAMQALGGLGDPSELALALDYRIQHILVDEYQDTSVTQQTLLTSLTRGWQPGDDRSLFLVGDPMQSIYRFRQADVGLFLQAQQHGIGDIRLRFLQLQRNFRSAPLLIDWFNQAFRDIFPAQDDIEQGAVAYSAAMTGREPSDGGVNCHWQADDRALLELIARLREDHPQDSIAILVRSRGHLQDTLSLLHQQQIPFNALEIQRLADQPVVMDLMALTELLLMPERHQAWLQVLRAPWCGLSLADLLVLVQHESDLYQLATTDQWQSCNLSELGQQQLTRVLPILSHAFSQRDRLALADWIKQTWLQLSGPTTLTQPAALMHAQRFLEKLEQLADTTFELDWQTLHNEISQAYADHLATSNNPIQVMTIHRAKGLEFDHVLIPGIERATRSNSAQLLWCNTIQPYNQLLLCPLKPTHSDVDAIGRYLQSLESQKQHYEDARLLYVAATRAREQLHWLAACPQPTEDAPAAARSFLAQLLVGIQATDCVTHHQHAAEPQILPRKAVLKQQLTCLPADWQSPLALTTAPVVATPALGEWQVARYHQQVIGTVLHACLQHFDLDMQVVALKNWAICQLNAQGLRDAAVVWLHLAAALEAMQQNARGRWILTAHTDADNELEVYHQGQKLVIDRTFMAEGVRWIIDYKTTQPHQGELLEDFYAAQQDQYRDQLNRYAAALAALDSETPIKLGLYFPMNQGWIEWDYDQAPVKHAPC